MLRESGVENSLGGGWINSLLTTPVPQEKIGSSVEPDNGNGKDLEWQLGERLVKGAGRVFDLPFTDESLMIERAGLPPLE